MGRRKVGFSVPSEMTSSVSLEQYNDQPIRAEQHKRGNFTLIAVVFAILFWSFLSFGLLSFQGEIMERETTWAEEREMLLTEIKNLQLTVKNVIDSMKEQVDSQNSDVQQIVHRALSLYRADGIGMVDYALESSGASVVNTRCSETYQTRSACLSLFGIPLWYHSESPRTVIQPEVYPGKCWAFRGGEGFVVIALSYPVHITHVTLEHLPKVLSPTGRIDSAPRDFAVYGMSNESEEGTFLGSFTYDQDGEPIQTFKMLDSAKGVYRMVELRILNNWGHLEYTCVYRFRVHGQPWPR